MESPFRLRRIFKPIVKGIANFFYKIGALPNHITCLMLITSILASIIIILTDLFWVFGILSFLTGIFDGVDGALARLANKSSRFGAFFDSTLDRFSEIALYLGLYLNDSLFVWSNPLYRALILLIGFGSLMISYVRTRAENLSDYDYDIGLFARSERLFFLFLISIIPIKEVFTIGLLILGIGVTGTWIYRMVFIGRDLLQRQNT